MLCDNPCAIPRATALTYCIQTLRVQSIICCWELISEGGVSTFEGRERGQVLSTDRLATVDDKDVGRYGTDRKGRCRVTVARHRVSISPSNGCLRASTHMVGGGAKQRRTLGRSSTSRSENKEHPSSLNNRPRTCLQMRKISRRGSLKDGEVSVRGSGPESRSRASHGIGSDFKCQTLILRLGLSSEFQPQEIMILRTSNYLAGV
jgi:hypothetical protein